MRKSGSIFERLRGLLSKVMRSKPPQDQPAIKTEEPADNEASGQSTSPPPVPEAYRRETVTPEAPVLQPKNSPPTVPRKYRKEAVNEAEPKAKERKPPPPVLDKYRKEVIGTSEDAAPGPTSPRRSPTQNQHGAEKPQNSTRAEPAPVMAARQKPAPKSLATKKVTAKKVAAKKVAAKKVAAKKVAAKEVATKEVAAKKGAAKKGATKKAATKKAVTKKVAAKEITTKKVATKKAATKKPATKKAVTKKAAAKEIAAKKAVTKEAFTKEAVTKEAVTKEAVTKEVVTKEAVTKEIAAKKVAAKKVAAKKVAAKKVAAKEITTKKVPTKKVAAKKVSIKEVAIKEVSTKKPATKEVAAEEALTKKTVEKEAATEKAATEKAATEKAATEKAATEKAATEKAATEKAATEKAATEKAATEKAATEKAATEKAATEKAATEKAAADKAATKKLAADEAVTKKTVEKQVAVEHADTETATREKAAAKADVQEQVAYPGTPTERQAHQAPPQQEAKPAAPPIIHPEAPKRRESGSSSPPSPGYQIHAPLPEIDLVLGIDFGTSCTKVVIGDHGWMGPSFLVPIGLGNDGLEKFLRPTQLSIDKRHETNLKLRLIANPLSVETQNLVILYLAGVIRDSLDWFSRYAPNRYETRTACWRVNLGFPGKNLENGELNDAYRIIGRHAADLGASTLPLESASIDHLRMIPSSGLRAKEDDPMEVNLYPEIAAQIAGYVKSRYRIPGNLVLVDVGAGTLDVSTLILHEDGDEDVVSFHVCEVAPLGALKLLEARMAALDAVEPGAVRTRLEDFQSGTMPTPNSVELILGTQTPVRNPLIQAFEKASSEFAEKALGVALSCSIRFRQIQRDAHNNRRFDPWPNELRFFFTGGGSRTDLYHRLFTEGPFEQELSKFSSWAATQEKRGIKKQGLKLEKLPTPEELNGLPAELESDFDRFSVAHGLAYGVENLMKVTSTVQA
jgi:hypothetical protein